MKINKNCTVQINDRWKVKVDSLNHTLLEYQKGVNPKTKEETYSWKSVGYFPDMFWVLKHIIKVTTPEEANTLQEYLDTMEKKMVDFKESLL